MESSCPNEKQLVAQVTSSLTDDKSLRVSPEESYDLDCVLAEDPSGKRKEFPVK